MSTELGEQVDEAAVEAFAEKVLVDYAGANAFFMASIGDRLGLFEELGARSPGGCEHPSLGLYELGDELKDIRAGRVDGMAASDMGLACLRKRTFERL